MSIQQPESDTGEGLGWVFFAAIMLTLVATFNIINGIVAISKADYLVNQLLFANMDTWGWFFLIWGILQFMAGIAIIAGKTWGAVVGIATAFFNAMAQLANLKVMPAWSIIIIIVDVLIIYALAVHGGRRDVMGGA